MVSYSADWNEDLRMLCLEFFKKELNDCSVEELNALFEIKDNRRRLTKLDTFLKSFK